MAKQIIRTSALIIYIHIVNGDEEEYLYSRKWEYGAKYGGYYSYYSKCLINYYMLRWWWCQYIKRTKKGEELQYDISKCFILFVEK